MFERATRASRVSPIGLAGVLLLSFAAVVAGQEEEDEEERVLRICEHVGNSELELGIEGVVRDKDSEVPLPGASVLIRYEAKEGLPTPEEVLVQADESGRYQACGLEAFREVRIRATYSVRRGDERKLELEGPRFVDLEVDMGDAAFLVFSVVAADDGRPVEGARIDLSPLPLGGVTDSLGRLAFRAVPPGTYDLGVRHIAYADREEELSIVSEQTAEFRIELVTQAIAVAPLDVQITGRDPYLLTSGFYERREAIEDSYFATHPEIEPYRMFRTLFRFKRELAVRFRRNRVVLINGRPASRLGFDDVGSLNEIDFERVRGIEAYLCSDAPRELQRWLPLGIPLTNCNLIAIWTR
ncbi:MAG: carboxypeptidase-like regulatory domain-containing protein [Gemmatimonadetes bacterium]|nr:carboxypeptidase-like regulatory domain-containing protein [Gemmatimonadota bacterium]